MKVSELFYMENGLNMELYNYEITDSSEGINFVSRTGENNGVSARIKKVDSIEPHCGDVITCALGGSVLSTFVQNEPFYSGYHISILTPKEEMNLNEKLFYCLCLEANKYKYSYGRQANLTLKDINLPDTIPEWVYEKNIQPIYSENKSSLNLKDRKWSKFFIKDIFEEVYKPAVYHKVNLEICDYDLDKIRYITRTSNNNGISGYVIKTNDLNIEEKNAITAAGEGVVYFYQEKEFICGNNMTILRSSNLNKYNALFLVSILNFHLKEKYSYGRSLISQRFLNDEIILPSNDFDEPDWDFMEFYIKNSNKGDLI